MDINRKSNVTLIFLTTIILFDFMGMAAVVVLFPNLLLNSSEIFSSAWSINIRLILMGALLAIYPLGQVIGASALGKLSDYHGRKNLLMLTLFGTAIGFSLSAVATILNSFLVLFLSRLLSGLCAGNVAIAQASLLDISVPETKAKNISFGQMAMGSAYIVGPVLGAWLSDPKVFTWFNMSTPFWFFSLVFLGLLGLTTLIYQDTLRERKSEKINLLEGIEQIYSAMTSQYLGRAFLVWLVFVSGWWLFESFMPTFILESFHFNTTQIGRLLAFNGALYAGFQYAVVQRVAHKLQPKYMIQYSTLFAGVAIISIAFTSNSLQLYTAMSLFVMAMGFAIPGIITYISDLAGEDDQGQVMGMVNSIQAMATVIVMMAGGFLNSLNFNITVLAGGGLVGLSGLIFMLSSRCKSQKSIVQA